VTNKHTVPIMMTKANHTIRSSMNG